MDEFLILLQAKLDEAKSKGNVNADIDKIQDQIDKLKIQAEIDPKTISNLIKQLEGILNQKINISNIGIDTNSAVKAAQQTGQQIGNAINQGITNAASKANKTLKSFTELKIGTGNIDAILDKDGLLDAEQSLNKIKQIYSEFGQVKITNKIFDPEGNLQQFRVDIQQVNGELKESRNFMMALSSDGKSFSFPQDVIKGSESFVHHLNEAKNISNATGEELNAQKEKLAEQEKYYAKLEQASKEQLAIEKQRITAGEKQLEILDAQSKRRDSRISYNEGQIDKKGLTDTTKQREINDLVYAGKEKFDTSFAKEIDKSLSSLSNLKEKWQEQGTYVDEFRTKVENLEKALNDVSIGDVKGLNSLKQQLNDLSIEAKNLDRLHEIQLSMDTGETESKIDALIAKTNQWTDVNGNARISTQSLTTALDDLSLASNEYLKTPTEANQRKLIEANEKLSVEYKKVASDIRSMNANLAKDSAIDSLRQQYQNFYSENGKAHKAFGKQLKSAMTELATGAEVPKQRLEELKSELIATKTACKELGLTGQTWFQNLGDKIKSLTTYLSGAMIISKVLSVVKSGVSDVRELDTALVDLKKTTTMTEKELEEFYYASNDVAKQMGVTTEKIINQASAWSRLGYSSAEAATKMAKYSSMFASISPGMDIDAATDGLVSMMKAYNIGNDNPDDVLDGIMSKINIIGNTAATSNAEIVNMLSKSSSAMAEANNTLEETIALETAAVEITRDDDSVGTAFKTIAMRIRGYDEETEEYIGDIEELDGTIANLTKTASTPGGISLFDDDTKSTYKSTYQLLKEISEIYDQLSDKDQAGLLEALAGKRQGQIVAATINNFEAVEKALDNMANSAGSADAEMSVIMDSLDYKLNKTVETATGIFQNLFQKEDMKSVIDVLNSFMSVLDKVTEKLGLFGTIGAGAGIFGIFKNVDYLKTPVCPLYI